MKRTHLNRTQLLRNAEALTALANGQQIQYWSDVVKKWCDSGDLDTDFEHRIRPTEGHSPACESGGDCPVCTTHGEEKSKPLPAHALPGLVPVDFWSPSEPMGPDSFPGEDTPHSPAAHKLLPPVSLNVEDY